MTEKPNSDDLTETMDTTDGEMSRPATKNSSKKTKHDEGVMDSTDKLDDQESIHLTRENSDDTKVPKKKRNKKHKDHTEVVTDSSEKPGCDESLVKVKRHEVEMVPKEKKRRHKKCPEVTESTKVQDSDNQEMESLAEVNRDEVERPRKKKHQQTEDAVFTSINSSASDIDHELYGVDDMPKQKKRKQQDLKQNAKNTDAPPSGELKNCDSPVKTKRKKKQRHGLEGSAFEGKEIIERKRKLDVECDEEVVTMAKCRAVKEVDSELVNDGASQSDVKKLKKKHKRRKEAVSI